MQWPASDLQARRIAQSSMTDFPKPVFIGRRSQVSALLGSLQSQGSLVSRQDLR